MFERISSRYDAVNRILSLGLDLRWRGRLAEKVSCPSHGRILDLATGTGDVLWAISRRSAVPLKLYGLDRAENMLRLAQKKSGRHSSGQQVCLLKADAMRLPFQTGTFDAVTMAFGIRNVLSPVRSLQEMFRVLKPGGRVFILEFSLPANSFIRPAALLYLRFIVPWLGGLCSEDREAYRYLSRSVEGFPCGENFCQWLRMAGFVDIDIDSILWGMSSLYLAQKLGVVPEDSV
jgi:demethylmenaquinone methyltransferase/2-methoxy-6-polyprenyl-1,4-benzoquinol methylase